MFTRSTVACEHPSKKALCYCWITRNLSYSLRAVKNGTQNRLKSVRSELYSGAYPCSVISTERPLLWKLSNSGQGSLKKSISASTYVTRRTERSSENTKSNVNGVSVKIYSTRLLFSRADSIAGVSKDLSARGTRRGSFS